MATATSRKIFVNLAVKDLQRTVAFFTELGFEFDPRFTDEQATCMIVSEDAYVMLLVDERFKDFTRKPIADSTTETEVIVALSAESARRSTSWPTRHSGQGDRRRTTRWSWASCTGAASTTPTGTSGS